jgi:hypothetical protein
VTNSLPVRGEKSLMDDGLFLNPKTNQNTGIVEVLMDLAEAADAAQRSI